MHDETKHGKWIPGYEGMYSVTTDGEVWSFKKGRPKKMKIAQTQNGYKSILLYSQGVKSRAKIEDIVLSTFDPNRPEEWVSLHKDGDPENCALVNLEWAPPTPQRHCELKHGKTVPGYDGLYSVTENGEVWSFKGKRPVKLKPGSSGTCPYPLVVLWKNGSKKGKSANVHSLVALTYLGPTPDGMEICHNNGDYTDARLKNLRFGTSKENSADMIKHGRSQRGEAQWGAKLTNAEAKKIKDEIKAIARSRGSQRRIARKYGVSEQLICDIKKGRRWAWL